MKAKDYLKQLEKLDAIINNKLIEKQQWKEIALGITAHSDGERVQSSGSQQKMADAVVRLVDIGSEINELIDRLVDLKLEIIKTIEQLATAEYDVLHMIYIQRLSFTEAADMKGKSYSWMTTVHGRALANLQTILNERENENGCAEN